MHKAILEDVLFHNRGAFSLCGQRHVLRLHVGWEAGILLGKNIGALQLTLTSHANRFAVENVNACATLLQFANDGSNVGRIAIGYANIAATYRTRNQESACLDAVGIDAMTRAVQLRYALHANR